MLSGANFVDQESDHCTLSFSCAKGWQRLQTGGGEPSWNGQERKYVPLKGAIGSTSATKGGSTKLKI
jgi:hypothetical protein